VLSLKRLPSLGRVTKSITAMQNEFENIHDDNYTARYINGEIIDTNAHEDFIIDIVIDLVTESREA